MKQYDHNKINTIKQHDHKQGQITLTTKNHHFMMNFAMNFIKKSLQKNFATKFAMKICCKKKFTTKFVNFFIANILSYNFATKN